MDKKKALKILNLDGSVSFDDAKKAYRNLAKKFHPDLKPNNSEFQKHAEDKMKAINLAFCFLAPSLKQKKEVTPPPQSSNTEQKKKKETDKYDNTSISTFFSSFLKTFKKEQNSPEFKKNTIKKEPTKVSKRQNNNQFDNILKKASQTPKQSTNKMPETKQQKPFSTNYQKYIMQKKIIAARKAKTNRNMEISEIEKIYPITRINRIGKI